MELTSSTVLFCRLLQVIVVRSFVLHKEQSHWQVIFFE